MLRVSSELFSYAAPCGEAEPPAPVMMMRQNKSQTGPIIFLFRQFCGGVADSSAVEIVAMHTKRLAADGCWGGPSLVGLVLI